MRRRSLIRAVIAILLIAGAALSAYWYWAADQVRLAIAEWSEEQRARGYDITYRGPEIGGFPARLTVGFTEPRVAAPQGWRWSGGAIAGEAAFWRPEVLTLALPRRQRLIAPWGGRQRELTLEAADARGFIHLGRGGWMKSATLELDSPVLREVDGRTVSARFFRSDMTRRPPTLEGTDDWTLIMHGEAADVRLPEDAAGPLGRTLERLSYNATLRGFIPRGDPKAALAQWRDSGGLLELQKIRLVWGPLDLSADGAATLDRQFRPQGAFTARIAGLPEALDAFARHGLIEPAAAIAFKLGTLALARQRDETGRETVEVPITLQDGLFYLGPVAIFSLAPVL
jgi:hypothetical protein